MKQRKIFAILAMVLVLVLSVAVFAACNPKDDGSGNGDDSNKDTTTPENPYHQQLINELLYDKVLGDFYSSYYDALQATDVNERYALMAIAEAKLLQSATYIPTSSNGGSFGLTRVAPGTVSAALWGLDQDRFHNAVVTTEFIKSADRDALKALYAQLKGTGTYEAEAKKYLKEHGYTLKDTYSIGYSADPKTWDIHATYRSADAEAICNLFDGLVEYDNEGQPKGALASSWDVSEDGLTYTFHLREGLVWATNDGKKYADLTAQDFVDGLERALTKGATGYLVSGVIKNAAEFAEGKVEMSEVGVKAVDKLTVEYTLEAPCTYFLSMFNYNPLAPLCKAYVEAVGEEVYGTASDKVLSCGPYVVNNYTKDNKIVFTANPLYWNKDKINIKTLTWYSYAENKDVTATYNDAVKGTIDGAALNTTTLESAKKDGYEDKIYVSGTDASSFGFFVNINRTAFETIQSYGMKSEQTDAQKELANKALRNSNFRMALARAIDKKTYMAQVTGDATAEYSLGNMYTPGSYVQLSEAVTVKINGTDKTFEKGTYYGAMVQAQLDADMGEYAMKVWDPTKESGLGSSSGFDGWYSLDAAKHYLELAIEDLKKQGVEVSESNPVVIDYPYYSGLATRANRAQALKKNLESAFGGKLKVNLVATEDLYGLYYAGYYAETGTECNYNIYDISGWGPDYQDPATYLNTMIPGGDMIKLLGIY